MRLIDADALLNKLCKKFDIPKDWDGDIAEPLQTVIDMIDNEPTAYDVGKVVEELENDENHLTLGGIPFKEPPIKVTDAIEIVRKGGVE